MDCEKGEEPSQRDWKRPNLFQRNLAFNLLTVACFFQYFNMQFLTASLRALEMDLGFSPKRVASFMVVEQVSMLVFSPVWGIVYDLLEFKWVLLFSVFSSAIVLMILGWINNFGLMVFLRFINGAMAGSVLPGSQKLVVMTNMKNPSNAFGVLHAVSALGRLICSVVVTKFASETLNGIFGWRLCSFFLGLALVLCSFTLLMIPKLKLDGKRRSLYEIITSEGGSSKCSAFRYLCKRLLSIFSSRSINLIMLSNFLGQGTYTSAGFLILYFQYCRLSNLKAGLTTAVIIMGSVIGGVSGGIATDVIHTKFPKYGRLSVGMSCELMFPGIVSNTVRLFGFIIGLFAITFDNMLENYSAFVVVLFIIGIMMASISFVDRAVLMDTIMPSEQSFGLGATLTIAGGTSALIFPPLMGFLVKDMFGYEESKLDIQEIPFYKLRSNAFALRNAIAFMCIFSTVCSIVIYFFMFPYFHEDARRIREKMEQESRLRLRSFTQSSLV